MAAAPPPSEGGGGGLHFDFPAGTTSISQPDWNGEGPDSWAEFGVDKTKVTSVGIPSSVTSIEAGAFYGCSSLASVAIPASVTRIEAGAFEGCSSLASVAIPPSVTRIEEFAFQGCSSLASVAIPPSVTRIEEFAFQGCSSLASVAIPTSVTMIGRYAFDGCSSLTSVAIPTSVTSIEASAFSGCTLLASVTIPTSVTRIQDNAFRRCSSLTSVAVPTSVNSIERNAFQGCSSLASVAIPTSVISIAQFAFDGCSSLASVAIPSSVAKIDTTAFRGCTALTVLMIKPADRSVDVEGVAYARAGIIGAFNDTTQFQAVTKIWATDDIVAALKGVFAPYACFADIPGTMRVAPDATTWAGVELWLWWLPPAELKLRNEDDGYDRVVCNSRQTTIWFTMLSAYKASEVLATLPDLEPELWLCIFGFVRHDTQPLFPATGWGRYQTGFNTAASDARADAGLFVGGVAPMSTAAQTAFSGSRSARSQRRRPRRAGGGGGGGSGGSSVGGGASRTAVADVGVSGAAADTDSTFDAWGFNFTFPTFDGGGAAAGNDGVAFGADFGGSNASVVPDGFNAAAAGFGTFGFSANGFVAADGVPWGGSFAVPSPAGTDSDARGMFVTVPASSTASFAPSPTSVPTAAVKEGDTAVAAVQTGLEKTTLTDGASDIPADLEKD